MYSGISWEDNIGGGGGGGGGGGRRRRRAVISLTTVDNKKGCWGFSFVFSVCMFGRDGVMC